MSQTPVPRVLPHLDRNRSPSSQRHAVNSRINQTEPGSPQSLIKNRYRPPSRLQSAESVPQKRFHRSPFMVKQTSLAPLLSDNRQKNNSSSSSSSSITRRLPFNPRTTPTQSTLTNEPSSPCDGVTDFEDVRGKLMEASMLVERANALANEHRGDLKYHVSLQVPVECLNQAKREKRQLICEPVIELHLGGVRVMMLSLPRMQETIRDLEANRDCREDNDSGISSIHAPINGGTNEAYSNNIYFKSINLLKKVLIGVSNVYLRCLLFISKFSYPAPIINPQGEIVGRVMVDLSSKVILDEPGSSIGGTPSQSELLDRASPGDSMEVSITIHQAAGIPSSFSNTILCHYNLFWLKEPVVVLPRRESFRPQHKVPDPTGPSEFERTQRCTFDHTNTFQLPINNQTLSQLADSALSIEVYGNLSTLFNRDTSPAPLRTNGTSIRRMASNYAHASRSAAVIGPGEPRANSPTSFGSSRFRGTKLRRYRSDLVDRRKPAAALSAGGSFDPRPDALSPIVGLSSEAATRLAEDWLKLQRRLDLWVAIEELMEDGSFKKVTVLPSSDVNTGGIYQLRQGLNRRIKVLIRPSELNQRERGLLPVTCETVTKVSVGSVTRTCVGLDSGSCRGAPDSYQECDLEMLRHKWCQAMDEWQAYLQENLLLLAKKPDKNSVDEAKEGYLLNRWVSSIQERDAIFVPPAGSSLPGAPATGNPPPGMEQHNPLLLAQPDDVTPSRMMKVGGQSYIDGEEAALKEGKPFVDLPLIKKYATLIGAVASWDSNLHEEDLLNKITPNAERIYLVVKEDLLWTGVAYQFVYGIPQMAQRTLYNQSQTTNLKEADRKDIAPSAESRAEQYMRTIQAVNSELYLDGLRQEVALQEALTTNHHRRDPGDLGDLASLLQNQEINDGVQGLTRSRSFTNQSRLRLRRATRHTTSDFPPLSVIQRAQDTDDFTDDRSVTPTFSNTPPPTVLLDRSDDGRPLPTPASAAVEEAAPVTRGGADQATPTVSEENMAWTRRDRQLRQFQPQ